MPIIDLATRKWLSPTLVMLTVYGGAAAGFLIAYGWDRPVSAGLPWLLVPALWTAHYLRRIVEALVVHRSTRPNSLAELIAAAAYYTGFGIWIGQEADATGIGVAHLLVGVVVFLIGEAGNAWHHLQLRRLGEGHDGHVVPEGGAFSLVSCPHYLFELVTWTGFLILQPNEATGTFLLVGFVIMLIRALARHRAYRREFDGQDARPLYPPDRKALIPFVV